MWSNENSYPLVFAWVAVFVLPLNAAMNPILYTISTLPFFKRTYSRSAQESKSSVVLKNGRSKSVIQRKNYRAKHHYFFNSKCNANVHTNNSIIVNDANNNANNINNPNHQSIRNQSSLNGSFCHRNNSINQRKNTYALRRQQSSVSSSSSLALTPVAPLTPRMSRKSSKSIYFEPNQCN